MPPSVDIGDTIGVMAPSSYVEREDIESAKAFVEDCGYQVFIHPQTYKREHQSAGTSAEKAKVFHELWDRPDIKAIWMAGGGNRCLHMIEHIDFERLSARPKTIIGFSDVTALLNAIYAHCAVASIHGPVFKNVHKQQGIDHVFDLLSGQGVTLPLNNAQILHEGKATGHLIGGNLSIFQYLPKTLPGAFWSGGILFLEDCNEELSRIDRMLMHLKRTDVLKQINGLIFGQFSPLSDTGRPYGFDLLTIIESYISDLSVPVVINAPFGHGKDLHPLMIGAKFTLDTLTKL